MQQLVFISLSFPNETVWLHFFECVSHFPDFFSDRTFERRKEFGEKGKSKHEKERKRTKKGSILLEFPLTVVQRAHLTSLQPTRDTVEMEGMLHKWQEERIMNSDWNGNPAEFRSTRIMTDIANPPSDSALFTRGRCLVRLALNAWRKEEGD